MVGFNQTGQSAWSPLGYAPTTFDANGYTGMPMSDQLNFGLAPASMSNYGITTNPGSMGLVAPNIAGYSTGYAAPSNVAGPLPNVAGADPAAPETALGKTWGWLNKNSGSLESMAKLAGGIAQIWGGIQANKIAKQTLALERESYQKNMANSIKAYNTALSDRVQGRYATGEQTQEQMDAYVKKNSL